MISKIMNAHLRVFQADCPDGKLYKSKVISMYSMIIPTKNASVLVDHIFNVFDRDSNGSIDFAVLIKLFLSELTNQILNAGVYDSNRYDKLRLHR